jgi:parallel beta-helix repeat protein
MLLVGTVLPVSGTLILDTTASSNISDDTLYVGGSGEGNYTTIQEAINDAVDGDTVFVYAYSSPYYENVVVNKSIFLIGEDKDTTVIDGQQTFDSDVILIIADFVTIQGFTIKGGRYSGIQLGKYKGIYSNNNIIEGNIITENSGNGIRLECSCNTIISHNTISLNEAQGIFLSGPGECCNNSIIFNTINSNEDGVSLVDGDDGNLIKRNNIINNRYGVTIDISNQNQVLENNIYNNKRDARIAGTLRDLVKDNWLKDNIFDANYWGRARYLPKPILAICLFYLLFLPPIPLIIFDWNPASEPYDI